jgi:hypothetical protein
MSIVVRKKGYRVGEIMTSDSEKTCTGEVVLGNGRVLIGPASSDGMVGLLFVEHGEKHEIGEIVSAEDIGDVPTGSLIVWVGSVESAIVMKRELESVIEQLEAVGSGKLALDNDRV